MHCGNHIQMSGVMTHAPSVMPQWWRFCRCQ